MAEHIVSNGETNSGIILNSYDSMTVLDGGMANDILVPPGGTLFISSGGIANDVKTQLSGFVVA